MGRWPAGAQERLQRAAIELFAEHGYDRTTVAGIAARAGLTERTYYNHFADKREVLFPGQDRYIADLVDAIGVEPPGQPPLDAVVAAFLTTTPWFDGRREAAQQRREIIDAHVELRERESAKTAALVAAIADALRERGSPDLAATLTAAAAVAAYQLATRSWLADDRQETLGLHLRATVEELRATARRW